VGVGLTFASLAGSRWEHTRQTVSALFSSRARIAPLYKLVVVRVAFTTINVATGITFTLACVRVDVWPFLGTLGQVLVLVGRNNLARVHIGGGRRASGAGGEVNGARAVHVIGHVFNRGVNDVVRGHVLDTAGHLAVRAALVAHLLALLEVGHNVLAAKLARVGNVACVGRGATQSRKLAAVGQNRCNGGVGHTGRHKATLHAWGAGRGLLTHALNARPALAHLRATMGQVLVIDIARGNGVAIHKTLVGFLALLDAWVALLHVTLGDLLAQALHAVVPGHLKPHLFLGKQAVAQGARAPNVRVVALDKITHQTTGFEATQVGRVVSRVRRSRHALAANHVHRHVGLNLHVHVVLLALGKALLLRRVPLPLHVHHGKGLVPQAALARLQAR